MKLTACDLEEAKFATPKGYNHACLLAFLAMNKPCAKVSDYGSVSAYNKVSAMNQTAKKHAPPVCAHSLSGTVYLVNTSKAEKKNS